MTGARRCGRFGPGLLMTQTSLEATSSAKASPLQRSRTLRDSFVQFFIGIEFPSGTNNLLI